MNEVYSLATIIVQLLEQAQSVHLDPYVFVEKYSHTLHIFPSVFKFGMLSLSAISGVKKYKILDLFVQLTNLNADAEYNSPIKQ